MAQSFRLPTMTDAIYSPISAPATTASMDIAIGGMTCASCSGRVERALKKVPGVQEAAVNLATESARIVYADGDQMQARLRRAVRDAGYEARSPAQVDALESESPWTGFGPVALGALLSAPLALPMVGDFFGPHWMLPAWLQFLLATPVQFILGARFYKAGWHALLSLSGNMDLLVSIGSGNHPRPPGQVAGSPCQAPDHNRYPRPACTEAGCGALVGARW
jgi:Cu+-exporting ATPase